MGEVGKGAPCGRNSVTRRGKGVTRSWRGAGVSLDWMEMEGESEGEKYMERENTTYFMNTPPFTPLITSYTN